MNQHEFNDLILDRFEALEKENKALKKQLKAIDNAEELLAKLTIASDQAKSLHDSMMVERKHSAEQSLQQRKLVKSRTPNLMHVIVIQWQQCRNK